MNCSKCIHFKRCLRLGTLLSEGTIEQAEQFCENFEKKDADDKIDSICRDAINRFGIDSQLNVAIEEMSELIKELCKYKRYGNNRDAILEELADCYIMLKQIGFIFDFSENDIKEAIEAKAKRLEGRMKAEIKDVKVGDSLYTITDYQILKYEVIRIDGDRIYASKGDDKGTVMLVCNEDNFGKSVYRSIEEAEQALSKL